MDSFLTNTKKSFLITLLLSILLLFVIYKHSMKAPFIYDDVPMIKNNGFVTGENPTNFFSQYFHDSNRLLKGYRPLTILSFRINNSLFGHSPKSYRTINLLIHCINVLLIFILIYMLLTISFRNIDKKAANFCAIMGSIIFCVHPLNTYAINLIWKRSTLLTGLFFFTAIILFILKTKYKSHEKSSLTRIYSPLILLTYILGLLCKEEMIVLPAILLMLGYSNQKEKGGFKNHIKENLYLYSTLFLIGIIYFVFRLFIIENIGYNASYGIKVPGKFLYLKYQVIAVVRYINLFFLPTNLNIDHHIPQSGNDLEKVISPLILAILFSLAFFKLFIAKRLKVIGFALFFFFMCLLPTSSIVPLVVYMDESRAYIAMTGLILLICFFVYSFFQYRAQSQTGHKFPLGISLILVLMICVFSLISHGRNKIWRDPMKLWADAVKKSNSKNPRALVGLANIQSQRGLYKQAVGTFHKAIRLEPGYYPAYNDLGLAYKNHKIFKRARACFYGAEKILPNYPLTLLNIARLYEDEEFFHPEEAIKYYNKYNELWGQTTSTVMSISSIYYRSQKYKKAYESIKKINPDYFEANLNENLIKRKNKYNINYLKGKIELKLKLFDSALNSFEKASKVMPEDLKAKVNIAGLYLMKGQRQIAVEIYSEVLKRDSKNFESLFNLGLIFEREGDFKKAKKYYKKAYKINDKDINLKEGMNRLKITRNNK